jgi:hypothetical protein
MTAAYKTVPTQPTEEQWGGLARDIVMWTRMHCGRPTGALLHDHLRRLGRTIPAWLVEEIADDDNVPAKGTVAACIYKAMVEAAHHIESEAEKALKWIIAMFPGFVKTSLMQLDYPTDFREYLRVLLEERK